MLATFRARCLRRAGAFVVGMCAMFGTIRNASAEDGKIPALASNPSDWAWVRIRPDGKRATKRMRLNIALSCQQRCRK